MPHAQDKFMKALKHNKNLPLNNCSLDLVPSDELKTMLRLWKAHPRALLEAFHGILDSRPRVLVRLVSSC